MSKTSDGHFFCVVENLITSREDVKRLSQKIHQLNSEVQSSGNRVHDKGRQLMELRYVKRNVMRTMELVADCRFVTSLVTKVLYLFQQRVDCVLYMLIC